MNPYTPRAAEIHVAQMKSPAVLRAAIASVPAIVSASPIGGGSIYGALANS